MWNFLVGGGPFMFLLVLTSIISLTVIIERGLALRREKVIPSTLEAALEDCRKQENLAGLKMVCDHQPSVLARLLQAAVEHLPWPKSDNQNSVQTRARHEMVGLERGLVVLEIIVGIAPLLGLVGTLHGLITLFGDLSKSGLADNSTLAKGIAIALNTTLMGLLIAIPTLVAWSSYNKKVESMAVEMETMLDDFLRRQYRDQAAKGKGGNGD